MEYPTLPTFCGFDCPCAKGCSLPMCLQFLELALLNAYQPVDYIAATDVYVELKRADGVRTVLRATMVAGVSAWTATLPLGTLFAQGWLTLIDRVTFTVATVGGSHWKIGESDCVETGFYFDNYNEVETMPLIVS